MAEAETKSVSLLEEFKRGAAFEAALVSTFNVYFPFLEELILRRIRSLGCSFAVALADAAQVASEVTEPTRRPKLAGRRYALLPVRAKGAFHPKIALFLGTRSARVIVGSHNLTMSGFGLNREISNVIEVRGKNDREGAAAVQEVMSFSRAWTARLAPPLLKSLDDFGVFTQPFLGPVPTTRAVSAVGSRPDGESLWERVRPLLPNSVDRVIVLGPFFDEKLAFLARIRSDLKPAELVVGMDRRTVSFPRDVAFGNSLRLVDASGLCPRTGVNGYLHAKAILIVAGTQRMLISGSANPTVAAWLAGPNVRNAEMVVVRTLSADDDDLGLGELALAPTVARETITTSAYRHEPSSPPKEAIRLLVATANGDAIVIENPPADAHGIEVFSAEGDPLSSSLETLPDRLHIRVARILDAALFRLDAADGSYHGWIHHVDILHQLALPSSQRRIRDALGGLGGDPSKLEQLLKMVEKVVFRGPSTEGQGRRGSKPKAEGSDEPESDSRVVFVPTLKGDLADGLRRVSSGDLGLLLDVLMRQLWRSLTHEERPSTRSEEELIDSDDEALVEELPTDPRVAELWQKKSATLLRRLLRRVKEGEDKVQVVVECAAVLGVLEAVRRVEDHDRWKKIRAEFVDRSLAAKFFTEAVPLLLLPNTGIMDVASSDVGQDFAEREALLRWLTWLAWLCGFGHSDLLRSTRNRDSGPEAIDALAALGLLASRIIDWQTKEDRGFELLAAAPRPGVRPAPYLEELRRLGQIMVDPSTVALAARPPMPGDLALTLLPGKGPMFVREVRDNKVDLVDFSNPHATRVIVANRVEILDAVGDDEVQRPA